MTGHNAQGGIDGGPTRHIPVMLSEVLETLAPRPGDLIVDGTFGAGGYSRPVLDCGARVLGIDRDPDAIREASPMLGIFGNALKLVHGQFSALDVHCRQNGVDTVDGVMLDIGVSSMQLDRAERGFSFRNDGPLDMRMAQSGVSAADVVNRAKREDLTRIIGILGEEKKASFVSRAIVERREARPFETTTDLANVVEKAVGRRAKDKIHPATRTFQALRIVVNRELEELGKALFAAERILKAGGRLVVVTFHSLEDRMVKRFFADRAGSVAGSRHLPDQAGEPATFVQEKRNALKASAEEAETNPRARSAKLRFGTRTEIPARAENMELFGLPRLADLDRDIGGMAGV